MRLDWSCGPLAEGLACYAAEDFFHAHEHWEDLWRIAEGEERVLLQALVQLAVALCHHQRGNFVGAQSMARKSLLRFQSCPNDCGDLDLVTLRNELADCIAGMERGAATAQLVVPVILPIGRMR